MSASGNGHGNRREVVVVTGASAGVGRAAVREFAREGAKIGLIARGREGLEGAKRDVEALGGQAVALPCDVSDSAALEAAADRVEKEFGPIDVWVNDAMVSVYGPFVEMTLEDYTRITNVTYLGTVYGTHIALKRMVPRNRGVVVQVSSALGFRSIPLQSAYCGAKHAIDGFTESVRCELMHMKSRVKVCVVALPGVNTPQFEWTKNLMPKESQPVGAIYQPEVPARAIRYIARRPRKQLLIGYPTVEALVGERVNSALLDRYLADKAWNGSLSDVPRDRDKPNNLYEPQDMDKDMGAHGRFDARASNFSPQLWADENRGWLSLAGAGLAVALGAALTARRRA